MLLLLTLLTACSNKSSDDVTKELEAVTSWAATAQMTGDAWIRGAVPTAYAKQTLSTAQKELHKETDTLTSINSTQRRTLLEHLQRLEMIVNQMSTAVAQGNHTALAQQLKQLSAEKQTISTLGQSSNE